jgi:thiol-disulfide isomerase/thioredoxin
MTILARRFSPAVVLAALVASTASPIGSFAEPRPAPRVNIPLAEGPSVPLSSYAGKVVLVDFWASWCAPCAKSFPAIDALYREMHDKGLEVVAVNVDESRKDAEAFLKKHNYEMPIAFDPRGVTPKAFSVDGMPSSFLIDRKGVIRYTHSGFTESTLQAYRREIASLLAEAPAEGEGIVVLGGR